MMVCQYGDLWAAATVVREEVDERSRVCEVLTVAAGAAVARPHVLIARAAIALARKHIEPQMLRSSEVLKSSIRTP